MDKQFQPGSTTRSTYRRSSWCSSTSTSVSRGVLSRKRRRTPRTNACVAAQHGSTAPSTSLTSSTSTGIDVQTVGRRSTRRRSCVGSAAHSRRRMERDGRGARGPRGPRRRRESACDRSVARDHVDGVEALGARATAGKYGFDRFWRNVRTHTLHDPVAYKRREVGRWVLTGELPEPTWYS